MADDKLLEYSGEHLLHELTMLWELAQTLPRRKASTETSALVESFGIHLRNLIDFFYRPGRLDDVTAQDFLDATTVWNPSEPASLTNAHRRANKELSHLTQTRKSGTPPEKEWDTIGLAREIEAIAKDFAAKASDRKLHFKVREFLQIPATKLKVWIGDNSPRLNVAVQAPLSSEIGTGEPLPPARSKLNGCARQN